MIYTIGDIHGQADALDRALALIERDGGTQAPVVFLGDYTDRGPDSARVLDRLIEGLEAGRNWICLKGNHDRFFEWFLSDPAHQDPYLRVGFSWFHQALGGIETMASYGIDVHDERRLFEVWHEASEKVPAAHNAFLRGLKLFHLEDDCLFVHAGVRPEVPLAAQTEEDLLWIRAPFADFREPHPWLVVHGHTPVNRPTHFGNRINMDGGAGYGRPLVPAVCEDGAWYTLDEAGRSLMPNAKDAS